MPKANDPGRPAKQGPPQKKSPKNDAAFDVWLEKGLHEIFDGIVDEPVPDELLRLIEEDRKR